MTPKGGSDSLSQANVAAVALKGRGTRPGPCRGGRPSVCKGSSRWRQPGCGAQARVRECGGGPAVQGWGSGGDGGGEASRGRGGRGGGGGGGLWHPAGHGREAGAHPRRPCCAPTAPCCALLRPAAPCYPLLRLLSGSAAPCWALLRPAAPCYPLLCLLSGSAAPCWALLRRAAPCCAGLRRAGPCCACSAAVRRDRSACLTDSVRAALRRAARAVLGAGISKELGRRGLRATPND